MCGCVARKCLVLFEHRHCQRPCGRQKYFVAQAARISVRYLLFGLIRPFHCKAWLDFYKVLCLFVVLHLHISVAFFLHYYHYRNIFNAMQTICRSRHRSCFVPISGMCGKIRPNRGIVHISLSTLRTHPSCTGRHAKTRQREAHRWKVRGVSASKICNRLPNHLSVCSLLHSFVFEGKRAWLL